MSQMSRKPRPKLPNPVRADPVFEAYLDAVRAQVAALRSVPVPPGCKIRVTLEFDVTRGAT